MCMRKFATFHTIVILSKFGDAPSLGPNLSVSGMAFSAQKLVCEHYILAIIIFSTVSPKRGGGV